MSANLFATVRQGYDPAAVEAELARCQDTIQRLEARIAEVQAPARAAEADAALIAKTLLTAQAAADQMRRDAEDVAQGVLATARAEAETVRAEARREAESWNVQATAAAARYQALVDALTDTGRQHLEQITAAAALLGESLQAFGADAVSPAASAILETLAAEEARPATPTEAPAPASGPLEVPEPAGSVHSARVEEDPVSEPPEASASGAADGAALPPEADAPSPPDPIPALPVVLDEGPDGIETPPNVASEPALPDIAWRPHLPSPFSLEDAAGGDGLR